jgi:hypothetical protein
VSKQLLEARGSVLSAEASGSGPLKLRIRVIEGDVQGSSGYYPANVLERDAGIFAKGTHMHLDHMGFWERMEGSPGKLETLAGFFDSTAVYETVDGVPGLYADAVVISQYSQFIREVSEHIGVSILAAASVEEGISPKTGEPTDIITGIEGVLSVDFVTHPGANGRIIKKLGESAKRLWAPGFTELSKHPAIEAGIQKEKGKPMAELTEETAKGLSDAVTGLTAVLTAEAQARKEAATAAEAAAKPDESFDVAEAVLNLTGALAESGLSKTARARVLVAVKAGTEVGAAIEAEKTYAAELLAEAGTAVGVDKTRQFGELSLVGQFGHTAAEDNSWAKSYGTRKVVS